MKPTVFFSLLGLSLCITSGASAGSPVDPTLPDYHTDQPLSGTLSSVGSDSLEKIMQQWQADFKQHHSGVTLTMQAKGSSTAPKALIKGEANIGPMSRKMKRKERKEFKAKFGYKPTKIPVAMDTLAIYVNKDNPIAGLRFADIDSIYSNSHKCGKHKDVKIWGDLGLTGELAKQAVKPYGRSKKSGTHGYIKKRVLCNGSYKSNVGQEESFDDIIKKVSASPNAIGYAGMAYKTDAVRVVSLAKSKGQEWVQPTVENTLNRHYPLARFLYVYVNKDPKKPLAPLVLEFVKMMLSKQGQEIVSKNGYIPLSAKMVKKTLKKLNKVK